MIRFDYPHQMATVLNDLTREDRLWRLSLLAPMIVGIPYRYPPLFLAKEYDNFARKTRPSFKIPRSGLSIEAKRHMAPDLAMVYFLKDVLPENALDPNVLFIGSTFNNSSIRYALPLRPDGRSSFVSSFPYRVRMNPRYHMVAELNPSDDCKTLAED